MAGDDKSKRLPIVKPEPPVAQAPSTEPLHVSKGSNEAVEEHCDPETLRAHVIEVLKDIRDPEIPLNIYDLGLIYALDVQPGGRVRIEMTLTTPACPVAGMIVEQVASRVGALPQVSRCDVDLTWDPPWSRDRISEEAQLELGLL